MSVDSWQPVASPITLDEADLKKLTVLAHSYTQDSDLTAQLSWIQPLAQVDNKIWALSIHNLTQQPLIELIRMLTQLEEQQAWNLAEKSPVIALFKQLRKIAGIDKSLVQWVKAHSDNRFLPFGPLL
ncbi:MAG: hypothetical protein RPR40_05800 [Bermanella sp.]|jgi:hypothetical protein